MLRNREVRWCLCLSFLVIAIGSIYAYWLHPPLGIVTLVTALSVALVWAGLTW